MNLTVYFLHLGLNLFMKKNLTSATLAGYTRKGQGEVTIILLYLVLTINLLTEKKIV